MANLKTCYSTVQNIGLIYDTLPSMVVTGETKILLHFDNSATADDCNNTWTTVGSPSLTAPASSSSSEKALYLNGSSYINTSGYNVSMGGKDFTVDFWLNWGSDPGTYAPVFHFVDANNKAFNYSRHSTYSSTFFYVFDQSSNNSWGDGDSQNLNSDMSFVLNKCIHIAFVYSYSGKTLKHYVNGTLKTTLTGINIAQRNCKVYLGAELITGDYRRFKGMINEFRYSDGIARWNGAFTPPALTAKYTKDSNTTSLLHFDTSTVYDECGITWVANEGPSLAAFTDVINPDSGTGSLGKAISLKGSSGYISTSGYNVSMGGKDFTVDFWINWGSNPGTYAPVFHFVDSSGKAFNYSRHHTRSSTFFYVFGDDRSDSWGDGDTSNLGVDSSFGLNQTFHIAFVYSHSNKTLKHYANGTLKTTLSNMTITQRNCKIILGADAENNHYFTGLINEFRYSDGIARWSSNFTPPTSNYTKDSYTKSLLHFDTSTTADDCGITWTATGSPTLVDFDPVAVGTNSLYLNGSSYLQMSSGLTLKASEQWFISFWIYKTSTGTCDTILGDSTTNYLYSLQVSDSSSKGNIGMRFNSSSYMISAGALPLNQWVHIFVENDGAGNVTIYVNGIKQVTKAVNRDFILSNNVRIGSFGTYTCSACYLDEFAVATGSRHWLSYGFAPTDGFSPPDSALSKKTYGAIPTNAATVCNGGVAKCVPLTTLTGGFGGKSYCKTFKNEKAYYIINV